MMLPLFIHHSKHNHFIFSKKRRNAIREETSYGLYWIHCSLN